MEYPCGFVKEVHSRKPICGVLAVALCAGVSYDVAHAAVRKATFDANPSRQRFGGRTYLRDLKTAMTRMAVKLSPTIKVTQPMTVQRFTDDVAKPDITYLIQVSGHFMTLRNRILVDQSYNVPVELHKRRRSQVIKFVAVLGKGW